MPKPNYISLEIDGIKADIDPSGQIPTVSYALEDENAWENKKSAESFDIELPATLLNDQIHNSFHDPSILDNTPDQSFENFKPAKYVAASEEILIGKYLQQSVTKRHGRPQMYKGKIYGLNGDWVIDLKEKTLFDFLNPRTHLYNKSTITQSWNFNGLSEAEDFVYAPARYRKKFGLAPAATIDEPDPVPADDNVLITDMKPAISPYWILWRGLKSVGYRIVSEFMDSSYYRRGVMPWTWGGFDFIDTSRWEGLKYLAIQNTPTDILSPQRFNRDWLQISGNYNDYPNLMVTDDGSIKPGAFDNNNLFEYTSGASVLKYLMKWQYPATGPLVLGNVRAGFSIKFDYWYFVSNNCEADIAIHWYKNGVLDQTDIVLDVEAPVLGQYTGNEYTEFFYEADIVPGDYIGCRVRVDLNKVDVGTTTVEIYVEANQLDFIKLADGSTVDLKGNYPKFKNYKWLDLLRGEVDLFDLSIQTDPIRKEVYIEPTHGTGAFTGYYNRKQLDYSQKVDISKDSELELFSDQERELIFRFNEDGNDGGLKKIQDRNQAVIGQSKYVFPERFKSEKNEKVNRFYSPLMHRDHELFKQITGIAPQLPCIIPENISQTSGTESENTYNPKRAYYKGNVTGVGGWMFDGINQATLPFMFAVNYKAGGEVDPVLSYSDQLIGGVIAIGLMKKFFLQRLAIIRHGRRYNQIFLMLNNKDISNFLHRESLIIENIEYVLTSINGYNPVEPQSTGCRMWMFIPKSEVDISNSYPSIESIQSGNVSGTFDLKWWAHLLLTSDIQ